MKWYNYIAAFFSGAFLCNAVPHFVQGISGKPFPTPFANPPGVGHSSPMVNVLWGAFNFLVGYILLRASKVDKQKYAGLIVMFFGIVAMGAMLAVAFEGK